MPYIALALLILGAACLLTEVFIPGFGFFGITGIILVVVSSVLTIIAVPFGPFIVAGEIAVLSAAVFGLLKLAKKSQLHGKIVLDETLRMEEKEIGDMESFLGKEGITKTPLKPFGTADFNGVTMDVYADGRYIEEKRKIKVVDMQNRRLIVKQMDQ